MAKITSEWQKLGSPTNASDGWKPIKNLLANLDSNLPKKGVYVIRMCRPFSINYPKRPSPVLYIGEGQIKKRLTEHLKSWVIDLAADMPNLRIEIRTTEPKIRNNNAAHKDVEADLLWKFCELYGALPLLNRQNEYHERLHIYRKGFFNVLNPGSGKGYKWALLPVASNNNYIRPVEVEED